MIKIYYRQYYDRFLLIVENFTDLKENKNNIYSSAMILLSAFLNMVKNEEGDFRLKIEKELFYDNYFYIEIIPFEFSKNKISGIIETIVLGFQLLNEEYPEAVKIE